jgi:hypothetical protein
MKKTVSKYGDGGGTKRRSTTVKVVKDTPNKISAVSTTTVNRKSGAPKKVVSKSYENNFDAKGQVVGGSDVLKIEKSKYDKSGKLKSTVTKGASTFQKGGATISKTGAFYPDSASRKTGTPINPNSAKGSKEASKLSPAQKLKVGYTNPYGGPKMQKGGMTGAEMKAKGMAMKTKGQELKRIGDAKKAKGDAMAKAYSDKMMTKLSNSTPGVKMGSYDPNDVTYQKGGPVFDPVKARYKAMGEKEPSLRKTLRYVKKHGSGLIPSSGTKIPNANKMQNGGGIMAPIKSRKMTVNTIPVKKSKFTTPKKPMQTAKNGGGIMSKLRSKGQAIRKAGQDLKRAVTKRMQNGGVSGTDNMTTNTTQGQRLNMPAPTSSVDRMNAPTTQGQRLNPSTPGYKKGGSKMKIGAPKPGSAKPGSRRSKGY